MFLALFCAACFLAYANGANDNFKGVASLFGSHTVGYRTAIWWATATTFGGSISSIFLAQTLLKKFSGNGLVPEHIIGSSYFLLAVALGAGITVILAALMGFPISTTHGLLGAIIGSGLVVTHGAVNFHALGTGFLLPLALSPILAVLLSAPLYLLFRVLRLRSGVTKEWCICVGEKQEVFQVIPIAQPMSVMAFEIGVQPVLEVSTGRQEQCEERYSGKFLGLQSQKFMDAAHFLSAGAVSFARGLNDTPKIAAILIFLGPLNIHWGLICVAVAMAAGGLLNATKIAETMSHRITAMNHGQGFAANLATAALVTLASLSGLPLSTTHVSVGALFGVGLITGKAHRGVVPGILLSWLLTLPCAALIGALGCWTFAHL